MLPTTNLAFMIFFMFANGFDFDDAEGVFDIAKARTIKFGDNSLFPIVGLVVHRITRK